MREASSNVVVRRSWERPRLVSLARTPETGGGGWVGYNETQFMSTGTTCSICGSYTTGSVTS